MPPHLHPRSLSTTSLFSTTLALAFLVVAAPHVLPCPVRRPPGGYKADASGVQEEDGEKFYKDSSEQGKEERRKRRNGEGRKCPIPRAEGGLVEEVKRWRKVFDGGLEAGAGEGKEGVVGRKVVFEERLGRR